jgi:L-alanine-DL-glutamate epimerase-like enolase superfamily enzyme
MTLTTDWEWLALPLESPFGISRGTTTESGNVVVRVEDDAGNVGVGGGAPSEYYGEDRGTVESVLPDLLAVVEETGDPHALQRVEAEMRERAGGPEPQRGRHD